MRDPNLNYCFLSYAVATRLPESPYDFYDLYDLGPIGCNRLRCTQCGQAVLSRYGYRLTARPTNISDLYHSALAAPPEGSLVAQEGFRVYLCCCEIWSGDGVEQLNVSADDLTGYEPPLWTCGGHPRMTLPATIDGLTWSEESAEAFTREALYQPRPRSVAHHAVRSPAQWLARCYGLLAHTQLAPLLSGVCGAHLCERDPGPRSMAADFFRLLPRAEGASQCALALTEHPELFLGCKDPHRPEHLLDRPLQIAIGERLTAGVATPDELERAKSLLSLGYEPGDYLTRGLAKRAPTWFLRALPEILTAYPTTNMATRLIASAASIKSEDPTGPLAALGRLGLVPRVDFRRAVAVFFHGPARDSILNNL